MNRKVSLPQAAIALPHPAIDSRPRADYTVIGTTQSLCPECMAVVPAKMIVRGKRVYFRKRCATHGLREDFVCSNVAWWDRGEGQTPAVIPNRYATRVQRGCPYDCGLCEDHEQHTCIALVELTQRCNLDCPMCFSSSGRAGTDLPMDQVIAALDRLVECEGQTEVCQLSGGEPTLHAGFETIVDEALQRPIDYVMINTNGIRIAKDPALVEFLAARRSRVEIYLQWDGNDDERIEQLRGARLHDVKRRAIESLQAAGINITLVATLHPPISRDYFGTFLGLAQSHPHITGLSFQPATYCGRHITPTSLEDRVTFPDVIDGLVQASDGMLAETDFAPLPCAHPNCHQLSLLARVDGHFIPLSRAADWTANLDLLAGGISFTPARAAKIVETFLGRASHCGTDCGCATGFVPRWEASVGKPVEHELAGFFTKVMTQTASATDLLRITITSFLDAYNFDVRQLMKCCTHHVLPSGHVVPFCAYNTLYRPGHLSLPPLAPSAEAPVL